MFIPESTKCPWMLGCRLKGTDNQWLSNSLRMKENEWKGKGEWVPVFIW